MRVVRSRTSGATVSALLPTALSATSCARRKGVSLDAKPGFGHRRGRTAGGGSRGRGSAISTEAEVSELSAISRGTRSSAHTGYVCTIFCEMLTLTLIYFRHLAQSESFKDSELTPKAIREMCQVRGLPGRMTFLKQSRQPCCRTLEARAELPIAGVPKVMHETGGRERPVSVACCKTRSVHSIATAPPKEWPEYGKYAHSGLFETQCQPN